MTVITSSLDSLLAEIASSDRPSSASISKLPCCARTLLVAIETFKKRLDCDCHQPVPYDSIDVACLEELIRFVAICAQELDGKDLEVPASVHLSTSSCSLLLQVLPPSKIPTLLRPKVLQVLLGAPSVAKSLIASLQSSISDGGRSEALLSVLAVWVTSQGNKISLSTHDMDLFLEALFRCSAEHGVPQGSAVSSDAMKSVAAVFASLKTHVDTQAFEKTCMCAFEKVTAFTSGHLMVCEAICRVHPKLSPLLLQANSKLPDYLLTPTDPPPYDVLAALCVEGTARAALVSGGLLSLVQEDLDKAREKEKVGEGLARLAALLGLLDSSGGGWSSLEQLLILCTNPAYKESFLSDAHRTDRFMTENGDEAWAHVAKVLLRSNESKVWRELDTPEAQKYGLTSDDLGNLQHTLANLGSTELGEGTRPGQSAPVDFGAPRLAHKARALLSTSAAIKRLVSLGTLTAADCLCLLVEDQASPLTRRRVAQLGGVRVLLKFASTPSSDAFVCQGLARVCISTAPTSLSRADREACAKAIEKTLLGHSHELLQFEGCLALTNLLAADTGVLGGRTDTAWNKVREILFDTQNPQLRTAALEVWCNLQAAAAASAVVRSEDIQICVAFALDPSEERRALAAGGCLAGLAGNPLVCPGVAQELARESNLQSILLHTLLQPDPPQALRHRLLVALAHALPRFPADTRKMVHTVARGAIQAGRVGGAEEEDTLLPLIHQIVSLSS